MGHRPFGTLKQEQEANAFALCLLMPAEMVERWVETIRAKSADDLVERMALKFQVEPTMMRTRLIQLGYVMG